MQVLIEAVLIPKNADIEPVKALATFEPSGDETLTAEDLLDFLEEVKGSLADQLSLSLADIDADQFFYRIDRRA